MVNYSLYQLHNSHEITIGGWNPHFPQVFFPTRILCFSYVFPYGFPFFSQGNPSVFPLALEATSAVDMAKLAAASVAPEGSKICRGAQGRPLGRMVNIIIEHVRTGHWNGIIHSISGVLSVLLTGMLGHKWLVGGLEHFLVSHILGC